MSYLEYSATVRISIAQKSSNFFGDLSRSIAQHRAAIVIIVPSFRVLERPQDTNHKIGACDGASF
jgi:hypothetical protein